MENKQIIRNWLLKAEKDVETAQDLSRLKHYDWSLFIWHLALEKILKAKLIAQDIETKIVLSPLQFKQLNEITTFNIEARYDDYKLSFYTKATEEYAKKWSKICEVLYIFFKKDL
jgi:HEPN domain-containing protein